MCEAILILRNVYIFNFDAIEFLIFIGKANYLNQSVFFFKRKLKCVGSNC